MITLDQLKMLVNRIVKFTFLGYSEGDLYQFVKFGVIKKKCLAICLTGNGDWYMLMEYRLIELVLSLMQRVVGRISCVPPRISIQELQHG